jgi:predicted Zn-dependent protease
MNEQTYFAAQGALAHARSAAEWAGVRYSSETTASRCVRNDMPEKNETTREAGAMCEVLVDGHFGYAATADTSAEGLQRAFDQAIATTRTSSAYKAHGFTPAQRPGSTGQYRSPRDMALDATSLSAITDCLRAASAAMKGSDLVVNRSARAMTIQTRLAYFSSNGAAIEQDFRHGQHRPVGHRCAGAGVADAHLVAHRANGR